MLELEYNHEDIRIIKRVIGLPNETVDIINGYVYINNILLNDISSIDKNVENFINDILHFGIEET